MFRSQRVAFRATAKQKRELRALAAMSDDQLDTSDIPELPPGAWRDAVRGRSYRPVNQPVSMRFDPDVIAWLKRTGKGLPDPHQSTPGGSACSMSYGGREAVRRIWGTFSGATPNSHPRVATAKSVAACPEVSRLRFTFALVAGTLLSS